MNKEQFYTYLNNPDDLNESSLSELNEILEEYPYFQTAHLLYLKNLYLLKHLKFTKQLRVSSTYLADREVLFNFLYSQTSTDNIIEDSVDEKVVSKVEEQERQSTEKQKKEIKIPDTNKRKSKVKADNKKTNKKLGNKTGVVKKKENIAKEKSVTFDTTKTYTFNEWLELYKSKKDNLLIKVNEDENVSKPKRDVLINKSKSNLQDKLIDDFINSNPRIEVSISDKTVNKDISVESNTENDFFITETLAKIYVEQKHYGKAINAYEKLSLKYPEKNIYFANQIKKIIKLINE